jgi:hypothetical protein
VFAFHIDETVDGGIVFSPYLPGQDIHLTVFEKEGKLRSHIHHRGINEPKDSPIGKTTSNKVIYRNLDRLLRKRLRTYHGNKKCFIPKHERWRQIKTVLPKVTEQGDLDIPLELFTTSLDIDFMNKELWDKVKIRSLLIREPHFGFMETKDGLRLIQPVSKNQMFVWPLRKANEIGEYLMKVSGFDDIFDYLEEIGIFKKIRNDLREKIRV